MVMTTTELGDSMAQLVWESFSDFIELRDLSPPDTAGSGVATAPAFNAEETLILFMWVHTQACQKAFAGRASPEQLREVLDAMHRAVFEDLEKDFLSKAQLPLFEQRVSARYAEYYDAASRATEEMVVEVAADHIAADGLSATSLSLELAEFTAAAVGPFRDYLEDVALAD